MTTQTKAVLQPGRIVATPGAIELLEHEGTTADVFLTRHLNGDWGDIDPEDAKANDYDAKHGGRVLSAYDTPNGKLWIVTEHDRSVTTLLLPSEY